MEKNIAWYNETIGQKVVAALVKNRFSAEYVSDRKAALEATLAAIPAGSSIGFGGSVTKEEVGVTEALKQRGFNIIDWHSPGLSREAQDSARLRAMQADVFITGANAVTVDGQLINVDATGNRVGALGYGPGKSIVLVGVNKIVPDVEAGIKRIRTIASPINNKRIGLPNPCATTGICVDCDSPARICNITTIMHKRPSRSVVHIILIGENLGY